MQGDLSNLLKQGIGSQQINLEQVFEKAETELAQQETAQQVESVDSLKFALEEAVNPLGSKFLTKQKSIPDNKQRLKKAEQDRIEKRFIPVREAEESAEKFSKQNPELKQSILMLLRDRIKDCKTKEELLSELNKFYPDPTLGAEALRFLLETTMGDLKKIVEEALQTYEQNFGREIRAGQNISTEIQKYTGEGLGAPKTLRDMYRDITGNPRDPLTMFQELSDRFSYKDLRKVLAFLFHSLGANLKSQGPSIPPALLHRLLAEVRSLQAVLGVYQFFRNRMKLVNFLFKREGLDVPKQLTFEMLAKQFVGLLQERYPTQDKVLQTATKLGIEKWLLAKIIVFSQLRDAIREVALNQLYRNLQHRDDLYNSIIELLESLEDELDELLEKEEEEEDEGEGKGKGKGDKEPDSDQKKGHK
jgi:type III secretion protein W